MFCPKCGTNLNDNAKFCAACGFSISERASSSRVQTNPREQQAPKQSYNSNNYNQGYIPPQYPVTSQNSSPKEKNLKAIIIALVSFIVVIVIAFVCWLVFAGNDEKANQNPYGDVNEIIGTIEQEVKRELDATRDAEEESKKESKVKEEKIDKINKNETAAPEVNIVDSVNSLISSYGLSDSVAVAIVDNITDKSYMCNGSSASYTAWGFYLPVYLAMENCYPNDYSTYKNGIMSSSAGTCNNSANYAMDCFGGPSGITGYIQSNFGCSVTSYGRKFGDVNSIADNYTCASEAALLMNRLNRMGGASLLCYTPSTFGVSAPSGTTMYAQLGTENISVRKNLNVFAIIKGNGVDYCVAVLTRNGASGGGFVNTLLENVNNLMKG